jgi:hypothetical protein
MVRVLPEITEVATSLVMQTTSEGGWGSPGDGGQQKQDRDQAEDDVADQVDGRRAKSFDSNWSTGPSSINAYAAASSTIVGHPCRYAAEVARLYAC